MSRLEQFFTSTGKRRTASIGMRASSRRAAMDVCRIAGGQRDDTTRWQRTALIGWAKAMGHDKTVGLLEETLGEEKAADEKLTSIAESSINQSAAQSAHAQGREDVA
jgi:hypothetical protein